MKKCLYTGPKLVKKMFPDFIWESKANKILLTFDDGPLPETTPMILSELNRLKIKAAFFCVGENIERSPSLAREILSEGHIIGNHTFRHEKIWGLGKSKMSKVIAEFNDFAKEKINYDVKYFRPPHGRFNHFLPPVLKDLQMENAMWNLLTFDYRNDLNIVKFAVQKFLVNNSIVALHDSLKSKEIIIDSIKTVYDEALEKGFQFGEPSECLKYSF